MNKVALITGSSRGIGRAIALRLGKEGYDICINFIEREDKALEVKAMLEAMGCRAMIYRADVANRSEVEAMVAAVKSRFGAVSLLVSNAGIAGQCLIQDVSDEMWDRFFDVNVRGAFNCTQAVLPDMISAKQGNIITISSIWGLRGASCEVVYSATKAALIGLSKSLAMELAPSGIRVNCIAPGVIDTDMLDSLPDDIMDSLADMTPMGRIGRPEDIAGAVAFFAKEEASFITGQVLTADGGFIL
ncbi:MAG: SDR family oxidoreductase [Oscillospiraceae bacterium]|nr:SDR family oxidoreductase [Oscillospiraceae bacterium]